MGGPSRRRVVVDQLQVGLFAFCGLILAFFISWVVLAQWNFSYGFWHDHGSIREAIELYGGQNKFRQGFDLTTREQRVELFAGINRAIHNGGEGLKELSYTVPRYPPQTLLREPEIIHLIDVAELLDKCKLLVKLAASGWLLLIVGFIGQRRSLPSLTKQLLTLVAIMVVVAIVVFAIGPVNVFNALHIWIFPAENQWFFYYQESLMSTMMRAPVLFGWIALEWVALAILAFAALQFAAGRCVDFFLAQFEKKAPG